MALSLRARSRRRTEPERDDWSAPEHGVICAFTFVDGRASVADAHDLAAHHAGDWSWVHLRLGDARALAGLRRLPGLPVKALGLFETLESRVHIDQASDWVFGVLPDFERDLGGKPQGEGRLVFALDGRRLLTGRLHALLAVDDLRRAILAGETLASPAAAIIGLIDRYVGHAETMLDESNAQLAAIEDYVLAQPQAPRESTLSEQRRSLARLRREAQALRTALVRASAAHHHLHHHARKIDAFDEAGVAEIVAWLEDVDHEASALQERGRLLHEEIDTLINAATNRSMRTLTVISTLLIPPTLIVGAFGMNVPGIPWDHSEQGFWIASVLCVAVVAGAFWMLRRLGLLT
jgi:zinc transporter